MVSAAKRYEVLDAWRGICACLIVLFHFNMFATDRNHLSGVPFIEHASLFVDFFFVLSGFVISNSYQNKLLNDLPVKDYIFLRIGRLYPMHLLMLFGFLFLEVMKYVMGPGHPFESEYKSPLSFVANLFLIQALNIFDVTTWNSPSWSISVEFYTYIIYALLLVVFRRKIVWLALLTVIIVPFTFWLSDYPTVDQMTSRFALSRCLYGFSVGILCHHLHQKLGAKFKGGNLPELLCFAAIILFVTLCGGNRWAFLTPFVFGAGVFVFAQEKGAASTVLKSRVFMLLGMLSYSIYMTHAFFLVCIENVLVKLNLRDTLPLWEGDILQIVTLLGVIVVSGFTYRFIESPANNWFRSYVRRKDGIKATAEPAAAF